jgi:hypothetical protein
MGVVGQQEIDSPNPDGSEVLVGSQAVAAEGDDRQDFWREPASEQASQALLNGPVRTAALVIDAKFIVNRGRPVDADADLYLLVAEQVDPFAVDERPIGLDGKMRGGDTT